MTISDKIFSYIDTYTGLTEEMVMNYKNSLIFIGDQKQIYHPLTGAYVGIGVSEFNRLSENLSNNDNKIQALNAHIHQNVVNSIWVDYSESKIKGHFENDLSILPLDISGQENVNFFSYTKLMTNQDVVVKGLHDYDKTTNHITNYDDLNEPIYDGTTTSLNYKLWKHISRDTTYGSGSTGIQVRVHHSGDYKKGTDEYGFTYTYWQGQDYITIDDHLTWSYISNQTSYLMNFSKQMAIQQANRVYHDILGIHEGVWIEKEFNEVFTTDNYGDLVPIVEGELGDVYVHLKKSDTGTWREDHPEDSQYQQVHIYNDDSNDNYYIYCKTNQNDTEYKIIETNDTTLDTTTNNTITTSDGKTLKYIGDDGVKAWLHPQDGYDTFNADPSEKDWRVVWYHYDKEATAQGQMNLSDGIQTIREVAYILDRITDGNDDDIINLTYNISYNFVEIQNLKSWQSQLSNNVVTSVEGISINDYVVLNTYSEDKWEDDHNNNHVHGDAKINVGLRLAQTYMIGNSTYAAYIYSDHVGHVAPTWISLGDTSYSPYYISIATASNNGTLETLNNNLKEIYGVGNNVKLYNYNNVTGEYTQWGTLTLTNNYTDLNNYSQYYILFNYEKLDYAKVEHQGILDGITTVSWVTTYFKWAQEDIFNEVNRLDDEVRDWVQTYISGMNVSDTAKPGQFVTRVYQEEGKIHVERAKLPLDTIVYSSEKYGNDFFVKISKDYAREIFSSLDSGRPKVYIINSNTNNYEEISQLALNDTEYYLNAKITDFVQIDLTNINNSDGPKTITDELIANGGNVTYFLNSSSQSIIPISGTTRYTNVYTPVDIHELLSNESNNYLPTNILNKLYYYDSGTVVSQLNKYFDVNYKQRVDGGTEMFVTSYVTYLGAASSTNTGLADAWDVRHTIESMFSWVNLKTNKIIS